MRILVIDDEDAICDALKDHLEDEGHEVRTALNGSEGLALCRAGYRPSVILLDLWMPVMDGWDFRAAQLADPLLAPIPVVAMSACGFSARTVLDQLQVSDYVPKPPDIDVLDQALLRASAQGLARP